MREPKASLLEVILAGVYNDYSKHTKEFLVEGMLPLPSVFFFEAYLQFATKWGDDGDDVMGTASSGRRLRKSGVDEAFELLRLA